MTERVGRNDPCPCGSGKKYKQCCMKKQSEQAAAKYTPSGKRKFKAKVISLEEKSAAIFGRSATTQPEQSSSDVFQRLRFRMTKNDFRTKTEEGQEKLPFSIPNKEGSFEMPEEGEQHLPKADEPFSPTNEDFRKKEK